MHALTQTDRERFLEQGYLLVPDVVPHAYCNRVMQVLRQFINVGESDEASWRAYVNRDANDVALANARGSPQGHGIVPIHHDQALWDVRQLPQVHEIFSVLFGTPKLWVTLDRVSFKAPAQFHDAAFRMDAVHWDGDPHSAELGIQGLVYLTDTPAEKGAFAMVPDLYRGLDAWLAEQHAEGRADVEIRRPDVSAFPLVPVGGSQGSMVLWHRRMPHTSLPNHSTTPRYVQYVAMAPAGDDVARERNAQLCLEKRPPAWAVRQRVPGQQDPEPGPPLRLSALGRKLAGIDAWD